MARKPTDKQLFKMKKGVRGQEGTTKLTPQKWGVIFVLQMCKNLLIRYAVKARGSEV